MLELITCPADLRKLTNAQLRDLAGEIREVIIDTVSKGGGHLASNLGAVELVLALHLVFDAPHDKLVFDVGHQAYAHKLLTGRYARFSTLRTRGGVAGFLRPDESPFDVCATGHASSAISTALGLARARDLMGDDNQVVAIVGDGAMTGGLCYEALNDAGQSGAPIIVVLNDNAMSISHNVGALSGYLTGLRQSTPYRRFKSGVRNGLDRLPRVGAPIKRALEKGRDALKLLFLDGQFFEALGFEYQGPIDGHDLKRLRKVLTQAKHAGRPVLLHVVTQKGHGYAYAEARPDQFHGVAPFFVDTGKAIGEQHVTSGQIMAAELTDMAQTDARVCAITAAMLTGTGLGAFAAAYPARFFDVGIAEGHAVSMAAGMALSGMRPYVAIYSTFLQRAYDQLIEDVCLQKLPVTLLVDRAGLVGSDGATHQGAFDLAFLRAMPNMTVAAPRDARDLRRLMRLSLAMDGPMAIRYPKDAQDMGPGMQKLGDMRVGEWELLADGENVMILAVGQMVERALGVSIELNGRGIVCGVVDARFIKPMDERMLFEVAKRVKLLVTLEEGVLAGGFGAAVLEALAQGGVRVAVLPLGMPDRFIEQGTTQEQTEDCGLSVEQVTSAIQARLKGVIDGDTTH
ncbi:MAG: 1-deoxy-D-xylulose-5-phosphate synthase [Clostridia bacterium]